MSATPGRPAHLADHRLPFPKAASIPPAYVYLPTKRILSRSIREFDVAIAAARER